MNAGTRQMTLELRDLLREQLGPFLLQQRWFGGKAREIQHVEVIDVVPMALDGIDVLLLIVQVNYVEGPDEKYAIPVIAAQSRSLKAERPAASLKIRRQAD